MVYSDESYGKFEATIKSDYLMIADESNYPCFLHKNPDEAKIPESLKSKNR